MALTLEMLARMPEMAEIRDRFRAHLNAFGPAAMPRWLEEWINAADTFCPERHEAVKLWRREWECDTDES